MNDIQDLRRAVAVVAAFVGVLWVIKGADALFGLDLYRFGVYPRSLEGLWGILFSPLVHGSWSHIFANTLPLFVLGTAILYAYPRSARLAIPILYLGSGGALWLFARSSYHIGASGLTHGLMFFIFVIGVLRRDRLSIALSLLVFFLYGGMIWSIFPQEPGISFEAHFFGALIGVILAFVLRDRDPAPPRKKYEWDERPEEVDDVVNDARWSDWHDRL